MGITRGHDEQDASDAEFELASLQKPLSCKEEEEGWKKIVLERKGRTEYFLEPCVGVSVFLACSNYPLFRGSRQQGRSAVTFSENSSVVIKQICNNTDNNIRLACTV